MEAATKTNRQYSTPSRLVSVATEFYSAYSKERLAVRAEHLRGAARLFNSRQVLALAEAAFLALEWKTESPEYTALH